MVAGNERSRRMIGDEQCSDGQPVREALGQRDEIRADAERLEREERPGTTHARLDLVEAEERGKLGGGGHELRGQRVNAAFAQDRLEEHETDVLRHCCAERCDVVRGHEAHAWNERGECGALRRLTRHGQRSQRPAVEAPMESDDAWLARRLAGVLERSLDRLGAGVAEERLRSAEAIGETGRQFLGRLRAVEVRRMPEPFELPTRGLQRRGVAVTEPDDRDPAAEVEILASLVVPDAGALSAHDRDICSRVGRKEPVDPL